MAQNLITFEKALKENYLPVWNNQLGVEPSALMAKIKKVPLVSNKIVASAPVGLSGGFGFGAEGQATPSAGGVNFERFESTAKDMYVNVVISAKAVQLTGTGGAMANALDTEVKSAYETAKWNVGRSLFGDGTGVIATLSGAGTENTAKDGGIFPVGDTRLLKEGLIIDIDNGGATMFTGRITAIDRTTKRVSAKTISGDPVLPSGAKVYVQNSKNREITGLGAVFSDSITSIYGVAKAEHEFIKPVVQDASNDISDGILTKALRRAKNDKNSVIDTICCGDDAFDHYVEYLRERNVRVEDNTRELDGGHKAVKFVFGNTLVDVVNESFVPANEMWGVDSKSIELHSKDWNFLDLQNGGIFTLINGESNYRALLANYGELMIKNPGGCVRITNC